MTAHAYNYPSEPGHRGIDTSVEAAASIAKATGRIQRMVYYALCEAGAGGSTTEELAIGLMIDRGAVQPRTSELKALGLIQDSGERRPNRNGKKAIVWVACKREASI